MDKEKLDMLWKTVESVMDYKRMEYDERVTLGSVFGQMRSEIERLREVNMMLGTNNSVLNRENEHMKIYIKNGIELGYIDDREGDYKLFI